MSIEPSQLEPILADAQSVVDQLEALMAETPPPNPEPPTRITPDPPGQSLTDGLGHVWTFGTATTADGSAVLKDTVHYYSGYAVVIELDADEVVWVQNAGGAWYSDNGAGYSAETGPPGTNGGNGNGNGNPDPGPDPGPDPAPDAGTILDTPLGDGAWTIVNGGSSRSEPNTDGTTMGWLAWGYATLQQYIEFPASGEYTFTIPAFTAGDRACTPPQSGLLIVVDGVPVGTDGQPAGYEWANCVSNLKPAKNYVWKGKFLKGTRSVVVAMNAVATQSTYPTGYLQQAERLIIAATGVAYPAEPAGSRDPSLQPGSSLHFMNQAINDGATWSLDADEDQVALKSMDVVPINSEWWTNGNWTGEASDPVWTWRAYGKDAHVVGDNTKGYQVHAPADMVTSPGDNGLFITDATNKRYSYCGFNMVVDAAAHTATANGPNDNTGTGCVVDSYNGCEHAYHQQIGASAGMIRQWELDAGKIEHKLIFGMAGNMMLRPESNWTGFGWPAAESDYNAPFGQYSGKIRYGELLGIPKDVAMPATLRPGGQVLWRQLQNYGGTVGIQAGAPNKEICIYAEWGATGSVLDDMAHDWPIIANGYLKICRNNTRATPNGAGAPLVPALPGVIKGLPAIVI